MSTLSVAPTLPALQSGNGFSSYLTAISKFPLLTETEETLYARRWLEKRDSEAAYHLVTSHLRLAAKLALGYRRYGLPIADLVSEANVGLMLAVEKFRPEKGARLSTYATWWIKATVQEYILRSWSLVKIGTTSAQKKLFFNLGRLKNQIASTDELTLTQDQVKYISDELQVPYHEVIAMNERMRGDVSLNVPVSREEGSDELQNWLVDPSPDPESALSETEDRRRLLARLKDVLSTLAPRERKIISERFLEEQPKTLQEIGTVLGISHERVRQIEQRALQKIREAMCAGPVQQQRPHSLLLAAG